MATGDWDRRVLSGMRPTGRLHLGHYHGVLKNWVRLQHEYECFFFVADWHALTTHYENPYDIEQNSWDTVIDWLAAGVNPGSATIFIQSRVPEHAELHLLLSMITPLGWLERVPSYKDQQTKLREKDLATYGFLGYPLLQAADILIYRAGHVPVGADQVAHVELTREVARRFNHIYGRQPGFEEQSEAAVKKMSKKAARLYGNLRREYLERGDGEALERLRVTLPEGGAVYLGEVAAIEVRIEGLVHERLGDLTASITHVESGRTSPLFVRVGRTGGGGGDNSNLDGDYVFADADAGDFWAAADAANNNGGAFNASYGSAEISGFFPRLSNVPRQFQWRRITYIVESPQLVDIDTSGLYTEGFNHWSHAGSVIGFAN